MLDFDPDVALRLVAAALVGGAIGLQRDLRGKPAGLRTMGLVALGSALAVVASIGFRPDAAQALDAASRVIQGVVTGVGFLGAGIIFLEPDGTARRVNTAAAIWVTASLGVVCGLGAFDVAIVACALIIALLTLGGWIDRRFYGKLRREAIGQDDD